MNATVSSSIAALVAVGALGVGPAVSGEIDPALKSVGGKVDIVIEMSSTADLTEAVAIGERSARLAAVRDALVDHADRSQGQVRRLLAAAGAKFQVFWINNIILVEDADLALITAISKIDEVSRVRPEQVVTLDPIAAPEAVAALDPEWGISLIGAPDVWAAGITGEGVVVANVDTGVRYTHEAVNSQYRGNLGGGVYSHHYNWWDPSKVCSPTGSVPCDNNNHGTHTMGTMVGGDGYGPGDDDIGVAPGAKWIAAKGCESGSCSEGALVGSAQWMLCPTRTDGTLPDCSKAPHVINNSWGGGRGDDWYAGALRPLVEAGIVSVFSAGNSGPSCATANSPGDYPYVISVGATDSSDRLADFSSRGPGAFAGAALKPIISAPGASVRSSVSSSNTAYASFSGTSMAAPHVTGTIALMLQANPSATVTEIYRALLLNAEQGLGVPVGGSTVCSGRSYNQYPSYHYGFGRLDAAGAVASIVR